MTLALSAVGLLALKEEDGKTCRRKTREIPLGEIRDTIAEAGGALQ